MPETSTPTLTPDGTTKFPAFQNNNPGNVEVDALKAYILSQAGLANGLATLDAEGKLNPSQIPVNLDDVLVYPSYASLPATGETGKLYITSDVNGTYYWNGTSYQILNQSFVRYRGSLSSLPSDPQPGDWFIAASSFSSYTSGHIYLYNGSSWDDVTAVFGQFVLKTDIAQTLGQQTDKVPSNKAVDDAINAVNTRVTNIEETLMGENEITVQYPNDGNYSSLMPNRVSARALKFAEVPRFRGKSRAWNQLIKNGNFSNGTTDWTTYGYRSSISTTGGVLTQTFNTTDGSSYEYGLYQYDVVKNTLHEYLIAFYVEPSFATGIRVELGGFALYTTDTISANTKTLVVYKGNPASYNNHFLVYPASVPSQVGETCKYSLVFVRDLTLIFPEGVPATVADCVKACPDILKWDAYGYSLVDTTVTGVEARGKNLAQINNFTQSVSYGTEVPCVLKGGLTYTASGTVSGGSTLRLLKSDGTYQYISLTENFDETFVAEADITEATFYGAVTVSNFQVELGSSKTSFAPWVNPDTLTLSEPVTLRSAGSVADELDVESGVITRKVGVVDLSTLEWTLETSNLYSTPASNILGVHEYSPKWLCDKYGIGNTTDFSGWNDRVFETIGWLSTYDRVICKTDSTPTGHLVFELATPTTESIDPVPYNFLEVEGGGTVETIQTQTPIIDNCLDVTYDIIPQ